MLILVEFVIKKSYYKRKVLPELPGCTADGLTVKEAIEKIDIVTAEWIETAKIRGQEIPEPKGKLTYV